MTTQRELARAGEAHPGHTPSVVVIHPRRGIAALRLGDLWAHRELLYFLAWRDVKVRYKQTALGAAWAIIQPLFTMVVFTIFFGRLGKIPSEGFPYPVYTFTALLPWQLFAYALTYSSQSLVAEARLITKVYFPRLVIPIASCSAVSWTSAWPSSSSSRSCSTTTWP